MFSTKPVMRSFDVVVVFSRERQRNVPKCTTHVQRHYFRSFSNLLFCAVLAAYVLLKLLYALISPHCPTTEPLESKSMVSLL